MKSSTNFYIIRFGNSKEYTWLAHVQQDGKLLMEYNLITKVDVTSAFSEYDKEIYMNRIKHRPEYAFKRIPKREAFLLML